MDHAEEVAQAEDALPVSLNGRDERIASRRQSAAEFIAAQYMAAACVPLIATVPVPTDRQPGKRAPFLGVFEDDLSAPDRMARALSILMRCEEGRELMEEMARAHGDYYEEFAQ